MKKTINGKVYDTRTAKCVGFYQNNVPTQSFNYVQERLFLKKTGEYFIFGYGGGNTCWAKKFPDGTACHGEGIKPVSQKGAEKFCEEKLKIAPSYLDQWKKNLKPKNRCRVVVD